jgi:hypothetical protein
MIRKVLRVLAVSTLVLTGLIASAAAQDTVGTRSVKIDFDFYAGKKLMPAGEYVIRLMPNTFSTKLILVQQLDGDKQAIIQSVLKHNNGKYQPGTILFNRYGDQHFLAAVQLGNADSLHAALKTRAERQVIKGLANESSEVKPAKVVTESSVR